MMRGSLFLMVLLALVFGNACAQKSIGSQQTVTTCNAVSADTLYVQKEEGATADIYKLIFCHKGKVETLYTLVSEDGSAIEYLMSFGSGLKGFACFLVYNNAADGNSFLFFNRKNRCLYLTYACYAGFFPIAESVDFAQMSVWLENKHSNRNPADTLKAGRNTAFIGYSDTIKMIEVSLKKLSKTK